MRTFQMLLAVMGAGFIFFWLIFEAADCELHQQQPPRYQATPALE